MNERQWAGQQGEGWLLAQNGAYDDTTDPVDGHVHDGRAEPNKEQASSTNATSRNGAMNAANHRVVRSTRSSRTVGCMLRAMWIRRLPAALPVTSPHPRWGLARGGLRGRE